MQIPAKPLDEAERIATLRSLLILDTPPEDRFDVLTAYASSQFKVAVALVSLVDSDRQWFKSTCGLSETETSRDVSFCAHAILQDGILEISDTLRDPRFADHPLVVGEPHIRFYAGCPLVMKNGQRIGTFCLIDRQPKYLDEWERGHLQALAQVVAAELQGEAASAAFMQALPTVAR